MNNNFPASLASERYCLKGLSVETKGGRKGLRRGVWRRYGGGVGGEWEVGYGWRRIETFKVTKI